MNKEELKGYMEFTSRLPDDKLSIELPELLEAADDTADPHLWLANRRGDAERSIPSEAF